MNIYNLILFFVTLKCKKRKASSHYLTVLHRFTLDTQSNSINRHLKKILTANCKYEHVHVCTTSKFIVLKGLKFLEIKLENVMKFCSAVKVEFRQTDTKIPTTPTHQLVAWDIKCEIIQNSLCAQMLKTTRTKLLLYNGQVDEYLSIWNSEGEGYLDLPGVRWSGFTYPQISLRENVHWRNRKRN